MYSIIPLGESSFSRVTSPLLHGNDFGACGSGAGNTPGGSLGDSGSTLIFHGPSRTDVACECWFSNPGNFGNCGDFGKSLCSSVASVASVVKGFGVAVSMEEKGCVDMATFS
jgi:hypothetical protein